VARRCSPSWLDVYLKYTSCSEAPDVYHFWTGVIILSAVLQRRVYKDRGLFQLHPNMYSFLVGPPGSRKSSAIGIGQELLQSIQDPPPTIDVFHTAPVLVQVLNSITPKYSPGKTPILFIGDEAPTFFRRAKYAEDLIPLLIKLWDCKSTGGATIARGEERIEHPYGCGIWGVVPEVLVDLMPKDIIQGGFASRVVWVFSEDMSRCFAHPELMHAAIKKIAPLEHLLVHDLNEICLLHGEMTLKKDVYIEYQTWYEAIRQTSSPDDILSVRQMGYLRRKPDLVYKLMMLLSVGENDSLVVEMKHFKQALAAIDKLEPDLPRIYRKASKDADKWEVIDKVTWKLDQENWKVSRTKLTRWCSNNNITVDQLDSAMYQLASEGRITSKTRGKTLWYEKP